MNTIQNQTSKSENTKRLETFRQAAFKKFTGNFSRYSPNLFTVAWQSYEQALNSAIGFPENQDSVDRWLNDIGTQIATSTRGTHYLKK